MLVRDVIELAKTGELSNLSVKDNNQTVLDYLNLGVLELYKRFPLNIDEYVFQRVLTSSVYTLPSNFMWLIEAYGPVDVDGKVEYKELPVNKENTLVGINTIGYNKVQVAPKVTTGYVSVIYQGSPHTYTLKDINTPIALTDQFIEPLLHYIGYRGHGAINGNIQAENSTHYNRFEKSCNKIRREGMITHNSIDMDSRIVERGFV